MQIWNSCVLVSNRSDRGWKRSYPGVKNLRVAGKVYVRGVFAEELKTLSNRQRETVKVKL